MVDHLGLVDLRRGLEVIGKEGWLKVFLETDSFKVANWMAGGNYVNDWLLLSVLQYIMMSISLFTLPPSTILGVIFYEQDSIKCIWFLDNPISSFEQKKEVNERLISTFVCKFYTHW